MNVLIVVLVTIFALIEAQLTINDVLIHRAKTIQTQVKQNIDDLKRTGDGKLAFGLENLNSNLEGVVFYLQHQTLDLNSRSVVEKELDRLQSRVYEELIALTVVKHYTHKDLTAAELIKLSEELINEANKQLNSIPAHHENKELEAAKLEVRALEELIVKIRLDTEGKELEKEEQQFVRHEHSLKVLLDRLEKHVLPVAKAPAVHPEHEEEHEKEHEDELVHRHVRKQPHH